MFSFHPHQVWKFEHWKSFPMVTNGYHFDLAHFKDRNAVVMKDDGVVLHFHNYKTRQFASRGELALEVRALVFLALSRKK